MGNVSDIILTSAYHRAPEGLFDLGFQELPLHMRYAYALSNKVSVQDVLTKVAALDWPRTGVEQRLEVLWTDDYATDDDSWGGRVTPYRWCRALVVIPSRRSNQAPTVDWLVACD